MARAVGAKIVNMDSVLLVPYNGGRVTGYVGGDIYLTKEGRRFIDEGASWLALRQALQNLPDGKMWVLTDSGTVKNNDFSLKLMTGAVREAATLDEAAKGIGCSPAVLEETVRQYNHSVRIGRDEAFGKTTMLKALDEPPFYYGEERLNIHSTEGGVAIDTQAAFWINPRSPSWVFLRQAKPSEIFTGQKPPRRERRFGLRRLRQDCRSRSGST